MQSINSAELLKEEISRLENMQVTQFRLLKEQLNLIRESLKPVNVIKDIFREAFSSPKQMMGGGLIAAAGLTSAYLLSKKKSSGTNSSLLNKLAATLLKGGLRTIISTKGNSLKETFLQLFSKFF